MRIISGKFKGKRLLAPKKLPVRPTTDFAKEGLFNILRNRYDLDSVSVLDLFSGTGNISFEFVSRGVMDITAVDVHKGCARYIERVSRELDMEINVVQSEVIRFLNRSSRKYDLIFADPPYDFSREQLEEIVQICLKQELLTAEGNLILEHSKHLDLSSVEGFEELRKYGGSVFSFFGFKE